MRTSVRLGALVLMLLIPGIGATCAYTSEVNAKIAFSTLERDGTEVVRPALLALAEHGRRAYARTWTRSGGPPPTARSSG